MLSLMLCVAMPSCLMLLLQFMRAAASRTFWTAGSSRPMRMAMIAITTNSSISVKAERQRNRGMERPLQQMKEGRGARYRHSCTAGERQAREFPQAPAGGVGVSQVGGKFVHKSAKGRLEEKSPSA